MVLMRICAALAILLLLGPTANAATITPTMADPSARLSPNGDPIDVDVLVTMTCDEFAAAGGGPQGLTLPISWDSETAALIIQGPTTVTVDGEGCVDPTTQEASGNAIYQGSAAPDAPGLVAITLTVMTEIPGSAGGTSTPLSGSLVLTVDPVFALKANVPAPILLGKKNQDLAYKVQITNEGNTPTRILFSLSEGDPDAVTLPEPVVIGSAAHGQNNTVTVTISINSKEKMSSATITISPEAEVDADAKGDPITVTLLDRRRGIPGFEAMLLPLALLGAALLAARRRA